MALFSNNFNLRSNFAQCVSLSVLREPKTNDANRIVKQDFSLLLGTRQFHGRCNYSTTRRKGGSNIEWY